MSAKPGFNIVGHLRAAAGLGVAARMHAKALAANGYPVAGFDVDYGGNEALRDPAHELDVVESLAALPFRHTLVFVSFQLLPTHWLRRLAPLRAARFRNAGFLFWELPAFPRPFIPAVRMFDAVVVSSGFVRQAVERADWTMPTLFAEQPLSIPKTLAARSAVRVRFAIPQDAFVFAASFDLGGDVTRKNPDAIVASFLRAFGDDPSTWLLLKCNGNPQSIPAHPGVRAALDAAKQAANVRLIVETMPYDEVLALYAASDAYVSLHRAEGLGLGPMEAMALGKPVIATGYSGNTVFMSEQNSVLLPYRLTKTLGANWQYAPAFAGEGAVWADVDPAHAAAAMTRVRHDRDFSERIAARAARDIAERQRSAWAATYVPDLVETLERSDRASLRKSLTAQLWRSQFTNPTQLRLTARSAFARLTRG